MKSITAAESRFITKDNLMQQKKIIFFLIVLFVAGSAWLSYASYKFVDPNVGKNWWTISFESPTGKNLDFMIENHSDSTDFHWAVLGVQKLQEGDEKIAKGETKHIPIGDDFDAEKITIEVILGDEKKDIYKNMP